MYTAFSAHCVGMQQFVVSILVQSTVRTQNPAVAAMFLPWWNTVELTGSIERIWKRATHPKEVRVQEALLHCHSGISSTHQLLQIFFLLSGIKDSCVLV